MAIENSVSIIGRLTADPELRQTQAGAAVCSVRIAVRRPYVGDKTDFFSVNVWSEKAKYLCRGVLMRMCLTPYGSVQVHTKP